MSSWTRWCAAASIVASVTACSSPAATGDGDDTEVDETGPDETDSVPPADMADDGETEDETETGGTEEPPIDMGTPPPSLDEQLAEILDGLDPPLAPLEPPPPQDPALVALGEALFFDPILSGNKDTACASCHHPSHALSDGLSLTVGTGATGVGPERAEGDHPPFLPRHSQSLFNVGQDSFTRMFWDGRVEASDDQLLTPAGDDMLDGAVNALAAQAMFPVLDRGEMRGDPGELTVLGELNELAEIEDEDEPAVWAALMVRLGEIDEYRDLFDEAYPEEEFEALSFAHAANAIAAYETEAFSFPHSPWDEYLSGDLEALSTSAKLGAVLFYTSGACGSCHSGPLLTDHDFHATGVVQLGPGRGASAPFDHGRELVTEASEDRFEFRTPSLRNVEISAPYMHDGALLDFEAMIVHYSRPLDSAMEYDPAVLHPDLVDTVHQDPEHIDALLAVLSDPLNTDGIFAGLPNVLDFLRALTDPAIVDLPDLRPDTVPSGLEVP